MKFILVLLIFSCSNFTLASTLPDIIVKNKPAIVAVGTVMPKRSPSALFMGTGFAIGDGSLIVTNAHVVPDNLNSVEFETLAIFQRQNEQIKALKVKLVGIDKTHDIAVLKILTGRLPALKIAEKNHIVREGESIAFTGFPIGMVLGLYPVTHTGIISAISPVAIPQIKSRQLNARLLKRLREPYNVYQLDATAYPGNSGSPVYNVETGKVIGVINKVFVKETKETVLSKPSGITYAIPIKHVYNLIEKMQLLDVM